MNCSEVRDLLSAFYDGELAAESFDLVQNHLVQCDICSSELQSFRNIRRLVKNSEIFLPASSTFAGLATKDATQPYNLLSRGFVGRLKANPRLLQKLFMVIAASVLLAFVGYQVLSHGSHDHQRMVEAMEFVATNLDQIDVSTHLKNEFGGSAATSTEVFKKVGYHPVASLGLPSGYAIENIQVLDMPCCKCTQTTCRRPDNSTFLIFEHNNEETGWFEHRKKRKCECGEKSCEVVDLTEGLVATFRQNSRHVTLIGIRDEQEIELLVNQFGQNL